MKKIREENDDLKQKLKEKDIQFSKNSISAGKYGFYDADVDIKIQKEKELL